ncbi:DMT family transporter [Aestuariicoccus sp. MJ-SS9]|uniref:DMT family transporter n=1 Tax=Aestuariicoccus sp. MJ-SS9 TaxID=3079855 RepID=UPI002908AB57|nr:DMT family transporter [Aestuariicoccus sp. MJ-SS9]MDU8910254.1 DMT family transporter [Aestuariicoccus sp. MJ-SS9]
MKAALPFAALAAIGAAWGATQPLAKIAVSEGYRHFGILFWQMLIGAAVLGALTFLRGKGLPLRRDTLSLYLVIALIGSVLPGIASYTAAIHLPAGVLSILLSTVPMLAFPVALVLGLERLRWRRFVGITLGLVGVALLILPDTSLPDPAQARWIPVALIASAFYAVEGNYVSRWGTCGLDPVQVLAGASALGTLIVLPLALGSGQFIDPRGPWGAPDRAVVASALLHAGAYSGYVALVGAAGAVFAVQVSYLVTLFGVCWAMLFLNEAYSGWIWAAMAVMLAGLTLVQPRPRGLLVPVAATGQNTAGNN